MITINLREKVIFLILDLDCSQAVIYKLIQKLLKEFYLNRSYLNVFILFCNLISREYYENDSLKENKGLRLH